MTDEYATNGRVALELNRLHARIAADYWRVTDSTQLRVKALLDDGAVAPVVAVADEQTLGRGRMDRVWTAPAFSSVLMSVGLPMDVYSSAFTLEVGRIVAEVLRAHGLAVQLKWPNDIVVVQQSGLRKLGGIIAEQHGAHVVLGIGLNALLEDSELPTVDAISARQLGAAMDREAVIADVVDLLSQLEPGQSVDAYRRLCVTIGADVEVTLVAGRALQGKAIDVDVDGALLVRDMHGELHRVTVGDVQHVRPRDPEV